MARKSKLELKVEEVLKELFPNCKISHNFSIGKGYKVDFVVHSVYDIAVECHGEQHFKYIKYFHDDQAGWFEQMKRDEEKYQMVLDSGMPYVEIYYDEPINKDTIFRKINKAIDIYNWSRARGDYRPDQFYRDLEVANFRRKSYFVKAKLDAEKEEEK